MTTQAMSAFIEKNKTCKVYFGERLTKDGKPVITRADLEQSDRVYYRFEDGSDATLTQQDIASAPGFVPAWVM